MMQLANGEIPRPCIELGCIFVCWHGCWLWCCAVGQISGAVGSPASLSGQNGQNNGQCVLNMLICDVCPVSLEEDASRVAAGNSLESTQSVARVKRNAGRQRSKRKSKKQRNERKETSG